MRVLWENGIECGIHYPVPIHLQRAYESLRYRQGAFPVSERLAQEFVSLPMFPELSAEQVDFVALQLREALLAEAADLPTRRLPDLADSTAKLAS
jgi:dTDP-4-amino-4,6-dideoxygalactose transaminase